MASKPKAAKLAFEKELKLALKHLYDAEWLTLHSPLATAYFLGNFQSGRPRPRSTDATQSGQLLSEALTAAQDELWGDQPPNSRAVVEDASGDILQEPGSDRYAYYVLELRYFRRFFKPRRMQDIWETYLGESRAEFYRDVDRAIARLGDVLLTKLHPTFRLEAPAKVAQLFGRDQQQQLALDTLRSGQSVALSGAGGIGKTTLATTIYHAWQSAPALWYTIRPTLNDSLTAIFFGLAHFLQQHDRHLLWKKLLADGYHPDERHLLSGLARADLSDLPTRALLVFDEADRLSSIHSDERLPQHQQLIELIDELRSVSAVLLVGQRAILDCDSHIVLSGLPDAEIRRWLAQTDVPFASRDVEKLLAYTGGNPRLVQLAIALRQPNETLADIVPMLPKSPLLQPLFDRLWARLTAEEQLWLQSVAIFRGTMPADALPVETDARATLIERQLLHQDEQGGLSMWPALRDIIVRQLSAEAREQLHLQAATIAATLGEYTSAAYHYHAAGWPKQAVQLWFAHRQTEIGRGQAASAQRIFNQISLNQVTKREREALAVIRAELKQLEGDLAGGKRDLAEVDWPLEREISAQAKLLQGHFEMALGLPDSAEARYDEGIATVARLLNQMVQFYNKRSRLNVRQNNLETARQDAQQALIEAQILQGVILAETGENEASAEAYQTALRLAEEIGDERGMASAHFELAHIFSRRSNLPQMEIHTSAATNHYERTGNLFMANMARLNLAAAYLESKQYEETIALGEDVLRFFESVQDPYCIAATAANLAEAYRELGRYPQAETYAFQAMQHEERYILPYAMYTIGMVRHAQQRYDDADAALESVLELAAANEDHYLVAYTQRALAEMKLARGDMAAGKRLLDSAETTFKRLNLPQEVAQTQAVRKG